jgi:hypothetical protein
MGKRTKYIGKNGQNLVVIFGYRDIQVLDNCEIGDIVGCVFLLEAVIEVIQGIVEGIHELCCTLAVELEVQVEIFAKVFEMLNGDLTCDELSLPSTVRTIAIWSG